MNLSFTDEYFPDIEALTAPTMATSRDAVVRTLQPAMPDIDLAPGTPTGDLVVSVLGAYRAAAEEANSRLMSDLNLENVANGIIYSCAFVRGYLGNYAAHDVENLRATGLVRLTYSSPSARTIPFAIRFRFGNTDDYSLAVSDSESESIRVLAAGVPHDGRPDTYQLAQTSSTTWAVDVPVTSNMTSPVARGSAGSATIVPAELVGIVASVDFQSGVPTASLMDLARMARRTAYSLTSGSRASTAALILRHWPETAMVSPVVTGDPEMLRAPVNSAMVMQRPAVDVYVRSARDMQRESQVVRLEWVPSRGGVFRGPLNLIHNPSRIISIEWSGATSVSAVGEFTVFTNTVRRDLYGNQHCGTRYEALFAEVVPKIPDTISRSNDMSGGGLSQYAMFTVVYDADPLVSTMASTLEAPDNVPPGVSVLVKSGPLVLLSNLNISYTKKQGVRTTLSVARKQIYDYLRAAGYPDVFRQTALHDIMVDSGVERVTAVTCAGGIHVSAASRRMVDVFTDASAMAVTADWHGQSVAVSVPSITDVADIVPHLFLEGEDDPVEQWAATGRTVRYHADADSITFTEVQ